MVLPLCSLSPGSSSLSCTLCRGSSPCLLGCQVTLILRLVIALRLMYSNHPTIFCWILLASAISRLLPQTFSLLLLRLSLSLSLSPSITLSVSLHHCNNEDTLFHSKVQSRGDLNLQLLDLQPNALPLS